MWKCERGQDEPCQGKVEKAAEGQESPANFSDQRGGEQTIGDPCLPKQGHALVFSRLVFVVALSWIPLVCLHAP